MLINRDAEIRVHNKHGDTPLHQACYNGNEKVAQILINYGAHVNARDGDEETPLHYAAWKGFYWLFYLWNRLLLDRGKENHFLMKYNDFYV